MLSGIAKKLRAPLIGSALLVSTLLGFAGQASAITYVGKWDPNIGAPFTPYRWTGEVHFDVPAACIPTANFTGSIMIGGCSGLALTNGFVDIIRISNSSIAASLNFLPVQASVLTQVDYVNGAPTGVFVAFNDYLPSSIYADGVNASNGTTADWMLSFSGLPVLNWFYLGQCERDDEGCGQHAFNVARTFLEDCREFTGSTPITGENAPTWISFSVVPEPNGIALMLAALGCLGLLRLRHPRVARPRT